MAPSPLQAQRQLWRTWTQGKPCCTSASSQASDSPARADSGINPYAALAAVFGASAAARLAAPAQYVQLAHGACPNTTVEALARLTGATLIPVTAALWCLKVI